VLDNPSILFDSGDVPEMFISRYDETSDWLSMIIKNRITKYNRSTHLSKGIRAVQHEERRAPSNIAVERNLAWMRDAAFKLILLEAFDMLSRRLDLELNA
jgi:hypothetical protein